MNWLSDFANGLLYFVTDPTVVSVVIILFLIILLIYLRAFLRSREKFVKVDDYQVLQETLEASINELRTLLLEVIRQRNNSTPNKRGRPKNVKNA